MTSLLLDPTDVLVFPDGIPLPGDQSSGGGRLPFPGTVHEALCQSLPGLIRPTDPTKPVDESAGVDAPDSDALSSLQLRGPLPWHPGLGHLFPIPLDAIPAPEGICRHRLLTLPLAEGSQTPDAFSPACLPAPDAALGFDAPLAGWWTATQLRQYLAGSTRFDPTPIPANQLWTEEARLVATGTRPGEMRGARLALRPKNGARLAIQAGLLKPSAEAKAGFDTFLRQGRLPLGGDGRLVQIERKNATWPSFEKPAPAPGDGPFHVRWMLLTPALFLHGSLPDWCNATPGDGAPVPGSQVCLRERKTGPFPRAHLVAHHLGHPLPVRNPGPPEPGDFATRLAVPAGSVYHFLCADAATATRLVGLLHDRTRSGILAESGYGHGLCARPEPVSAPDLRSLATRLFHP